MVNLIKNAIKFTEEGSITVKTKYDPLTRLLSVRVVDTGLGISREDVRGLFKKFGKLQRTAAINSAGIGLGLTIVKQIVESAGGKVSVSSDGVGQGSTFGFTLTLDKVESEPRREIDAVQVVPPTFFEIPAASDCSEDEQISLNMVHSINEKS